MYPRHRPFSLHCRKRIANVSLRSAAQKVNVDTSAKHFPFKDVEMKMYSWWEQNGYFKPNASSTNETFVLPMPPPNVTGSLHIGHALGLAIQDLLTRFHRMRGRETLWVPGTDHAGIATQLQVEKSLSRQGLSREGLGREKFVEKVFDWKDEKGSYIIEQMRRLGVSADWSRQQFTLSPSMSDAVVEAFIRLHERGLIYRGSYMINWCPLLQTAVSDLEVEFSEEEGKLFHFKYELTELSADGQRLFIPVATTRPETILGDAAICVHPEDPRYTSFIGKTVRVPCSDRIIPVIADTAVDPSFGTGALKVTPAHDHNDYAIGMRHNLQTINIMNKDATINEFGGTLFAGLNRFHCRERIWEELRRLDLAIKVVPHLQRIPRSQRGGEIVEPLVSEQWFLRMESMATKALDAVSTKDIKIVPTRFEAVWENWLQNIRDWCISRQLWWGHRIPVYYVNGSKLNYVVAKSLEEAKLIADKKFGGQVSLVQDEDVLDTWFSSGLWPFATLGWPQATTDMHRYYPAAVLETGYDILFFWVARMVMLGHELTGKSPFHTVYLHGLVRDGQGQKMSKTRGNVIDPIETAEAHGVDTLRLALLLATTTPGQDVALSIDRIEGSRNFVNKIWNIGKFVSYRLKSLPDDEKNSLLNDISTVSNLNQGLHRISEQYIIASCHDTIVKVTNHLEKYQFAEAGARLQSFFWDDLADWFVEISKTRNQSPAEVYESNRVLLYVWDMALRLLHPFAPFITEALWQQIRSDRSRDSIMIDNWPLHQERINDLAIDNDAIEKFQLFKNVVTSTRNIRAEYQTEPGKKISACIQVSGDCRDLVKMLESEMASLCLLAGLSESSTIIVNVSEDVWDCKHFKNVRTAHGLVREDVHVFIPVDDMRNPRLELDRLLKVKSQLEKEISGLEVRIRSPGFLVKASLKIRQETEVALRDKQDKLQAIVNSIVALSGEDVK